MIYVADRPQFLSQNSFIAFIFYSVVSKAALIKANGFDTLAKFCLKSRLKLEL